MYEIGKDALPEFLKRQKEKEEDRIAFYIQNSGIKTDGSITNPMFFGCIPSEYQKKIIWIKDKEPETLVKYQTRQIKQENIFYYKTLIEDTMSKR